MPDSAIPSTVSTKVLDFLAARKTGSVTLDIADGRIKSCRITEHVRIDKPKVENID